MMSYFHCLIGLQVDYHDVLKVLVRFRSRRRLFSLVGPTYSLLRELREDCRICQGYV